MTLTAAWVRHLKQGEELVVATDSRLRFGRAWDCCPKLFMLPRSDAVLCFAHNTAFAYPIIHQVRTAVEFYAKARSRAMDLGAMRGHILRVMNGMLPFIHDTPRGMSGAEDLDTVFLLAGYSWLQGAFRIWSFHYDAEARFFKYDTARRYGTRRYLFAGDEVKEARRRLAEILRKRGKGSSDGLDMEPFEVLRDMSRDKAYPSIGGPPQVCKVYRHMNVMPYAIAWPDRDGAVSLLGRPLLPYERTTLLVLDPDTLETFNQEPSAPEPAT